MGSLENHMSTSILFAMPSDHKFFIIVNIEFNNNKISVV